MTRKRVDVAAGVLLRADGAYLLGQRAPDTVYAGYWEFPGGKVEPGETPAQALCRELDEELGIRVTRLRPWLLREHRYEHAHVRLHFFEVAAWEGALDDKVHSALVWVRPGEVAPEPMLPANGPILKALRLPRTMGITRAAQVGVDAQLAALERALACGLQLVQLREHGLDPAAREAFAREALARVHAHGGLLLINADAGLVQRIGADGIHLPAHTLMAARSRPEFGWVGASCHSRAELEHAAALGLDYALLGPVRPTATHPGQPALGWPGFAGLAAGLPVPVFALGGLGEQDMESAREAGAHGIAAIRGAWAVAD
ncbi:Nudix family hydrolase [Thauera chlorobenzoica]|uniref:8-oxo-dGTP diphosphatase n=1 Tax=Thauera chlorobenzoica TaxID=96773 RepID=A0A1H5XI43_9RHOO|nr:Nudix family hydrolase [Thauera chlorobenzoica]APR03402.1 MutT pyrophosphorylase [Thauera chlorobenzoica]SEG11389.1 8-oxo-dGTP diphosphatase [Thauera chlorobenzoica]